MLPATFETIYTACRSQVRIPGQGEMLYEMLVMEIDQCSLHLLRELEASRDTGNLMDWLGQFVQVCEWFEGKVVRLGQLVQDVLWGIFLFQALLQSLLAYLDRAFIPKDMKRQNIRSVVWSPHACSWNG